MGIPFAKNLRILLIVTAGGHLCLQINGHSLPEALVELVGA